MCIGLPKQSKLGDLCHADLPKVVAVQNATSDLTQGAINQEYWPTRGLLSQVSLPSKAVETKERIKIKEKYQKNGANSAKKNK